MASLLNYSFNPLLAAAAINTIITIIVTCLGLAQKRRKGEVQVSLDKAIKRSIELYSEYEKLVKIHEQDEQRWLQKEFNSKADQAQDHEVKCEIKAHVNSAFRGQAYKIEKEYGNLKSTK